MPGSSFAEDAPRTYTIEGLGGERYRAYKMVVFTGFIGEYYGVMGTSWRDPPILEHALRGARDPRAASTCSSTTATACAWSAGRPTRGSYWISNTLLQTLSAKEMLGRRALAHQGALVR